MEKLLPQNIEAEAGVLGSIIIDPEAFDQVADFLKAEDFYRDAHRTIFETIELLHEHDMPADCITICDELERSNKLEDVGGAGYIISLINQVPTSGNVEYYGRIVERTAILRRLIHAAGQIAAIAYEEAEPEIALDKAEALIFDLTNKRQIGDEATGQELANNVMAILEYRHEHRGINVGLPTGFTSLTEINPFRPGELTLLAARPSMGKTALALSMIYNLIQEGATIGMISLEMTKEQLMERLYAIASKTDLARITSGYIEDDDWERLSEQQPVLYTSNLIIKEAGSMTTMQIRSTVRRWKSQYPLDLVIIDYLQLIQASTKRKDGNRVLEVGDISRSIKALAMECKIPILALAQLSRAVENRASKIPQMSDLRESGNLEQDADNIWFIYRDVVYNPETERKLEADIIIAKQRNGPTGQVELIFKAPSTRFIEAA